MKKLMFAGIAALCATVVADSIESQNVVGYLTAETNVQAARNYLIGTQFETAGDAANEVFLDDLLNLSSTITPGTWTDGDFTLGNAPVVMLFNGIGYEYYYYIDNATYDEYYKGEFVDYKEYENNPCWATGDGIALDPYDVTIDAGKGFWVRGNGTGKVTFD